MSILTQRSKKSVSGGSSAAEAVAQFGTTKVRESVRCRVCGRTLLMGERTIGFFTEQSQGPFDVCELCVPRAGQFGLRPRPATPDDATELVRKNRFLSRLGRRRNPLAATVPVGTAAVPAALAAFNHSAHARTLAGLYKTLGAPRASAIPRTATDREVILTVAWEIVWYQFRITQDGIEPKRGTYLNELPVRWQQWNCSISADGRVSSPQPERSADVLIDYGSRTAS